MSSSSPSQRTGPGISPQATIHKEAFISGSHPISIGANAVIQLRAKISSTHGPVTVGEGCVVYERAVVGAVLSSQPIVISAAADSTTTSTSSRDILGREARAVELSPLPLKEPEEVVLEKGVVVESGATVEAGSRLGEGTVVEVGARVGRGAVLGKHCKISPLCSIPAYDILPDHTIMYGNNERRRVQPVDLQAGLRGASLVVVQKQVEALRAIRS